MRWIRASCPAQRGFAQKAWFLPKAPPPAAAGHIALRNPASRKPGVSLHGHPLGGAKRCFAERHRLAHVPASPGTIHRMSHIELTVLGAGNMGRALIGGL